jgi:hypothetical protein
MDANDTNDANSSPPDAAATTTATPSAAWKRVDIRGAGVSIEHRGDWATLEDKQLVYQRFSNEGAVSVRWGPDATIDNVLGTVGMGSMGTTRKIEADDPATVDGMTARRVRIRVTEPPVHGTTPSGDPVRIFVFIGFTVGSTPVLIGYRSPLSELAAVEPLLEHALASVRKL